MTNTMSNATRMRSQPHRLRHRRPAISRAVDCAAASHDRHEEGKREHREQQLGHARVHRHRAEQRADRDEPDRGEQRDPGERDDHRRERRGCRTDDGGNRHELHEHGTNTRFAERLAEVDRLARDRRAEQRVHRAIGQLDAERALQPEQAGEGEDHPEHARARDRPRRPRSRPTRSRRSTIASSENTSAERNAVRVRNSIAMSLRAMSQAAATKTGASGVAPRASPGGDDRRSGDQVRAHADTISR